MESRIGIEFSPEEEKEKEKEEEKEEEKKRRWAGAGPGPGPPRRYLPRQPLSVWPALSFSLHRLITIIIIPKKLSRALRRPKVKYTCSVRVNYEQTSALGFSPRKTKACT
jgi:hypothetical protein